MKFPTTILFILLMTFASVKVDFQETELLQVNDLPNTRISVRANFSCYLNRTYCLYGAWYDLERDSASHQLSINMTNTGKGTCWFPLLEYSLPHCTQVAIWYLLANDRDRTKKATVNWRSSNGTLLAKAVVLVEEPMDPVPPPPPPPSPPPPKTTINVTETFFCDLPGTFCIIGYYYEEKKNYLIERALNNTGLVCTNATEITHNILLNLDKFGGDEHYQNNSVCSYFYHNCTTNSEALTFDHSLGYPIANSTIIQNSTWNLVDYGYFSVGVPTVEARLFMPPMLYAFVTRHNINPEQLQTPTDWITSDPF